MSDAPFIDVSDQLRLLGTAHVATSSVEAVQHHIDAFAPDVVAVELCPTRYEALRSDRRLDREGLRRVMKEGKAPLVLLQALLAAEQRKMGLDEGQQPGAELLAAVECAEARDLRVELVDRDIQTTLRRAWRRMRLRERVRLLWENCLIIAASLATDPAKIEASVYSSPNLKYAGNSDSSCLNI